MATPLLSKEQVSNLDLILGTTFARVTAKYRKGQAEHGGNLWERPLLKDLAGEVTDLNCYMVTLEHKVAQLSNLVADIQQIVMRCKLNHATSTLTSDHLCDVSAMLETLNQKLQNL